MTNQKMSLNIVKSWGPEIGKHSLSVSNRQNETFIDSNGQGYKT